MNKNEMLFTTGLLESRISTFRGEQVMVDRDLAELYDVETKVFNQATSFSDLLDSNKIKHNIQN